MTLERDATTGRYEPNPTQTDEIAELKKQLTAARTTIDDQQKHIDEASVTVDISERLFRTTSDVHKYFDDQHLRDLAEATLSDENRERRRRDLSPLTFTDEEWEAAIETQVEELLADRTLNGAREEGPLLRTLKMYNPKDKSIRQIPYEGQFNNIAGSLSDGLIRYERKGFKRVEPFICPAGDCNEEAAVVRSGKNEGTWRFSGYCSDDHFQRTELRAVGDLPGVVNRAAVSAPSS